MRSDRFSVKLRSQNDRIYDYLESLGATGHSSEDVVAVHRAKDQARPVPRLSTATTTYRLAATTLQATHANSGQELRATLHFDLRTTIEQKSSSPVVLSLRRGSDSRESGRGMNRKFEIVRVTSAQADECCLGDRKKVPSTKGYLSKTSIGARQRTHDTLDH